MPAYGRFHRQAQIFFSQDLPVLPLFLWPRFALARPVVKNFEMNPTAESELWDLETLDVERGAISP
jgi:hypothetical protein